MVSTITSFSNPVVRRAKKLHRARGRREAGLTLVEGPTVFAHMVAAGVIPESIIVSESDGATIELCESHGWTPSLVTDEVLNAAGDAVHPQSPVVVIRIPDRTAIRSRDTLILNDIADPGNVGTLIRSAAAFGWDVCVSGTTADPWSPKVVRAGVGSHFGMHISSSEDPMADAHEIGLELVATVVADGGEPVRAERRIGLLIGSEARGLSEEVIGKADRTVTLSMPGEAESLNAAVAASILMYVLTREA
jgi:TrmH family RNA methyltransferase